MARIAAWLGLGRLPAPDIVAPRAPQDGAADHTAAAVAAHRDLLCNPHLSTSEKIVLLDLIERAGCTLGQTIGPCVPIGGLKDEDKTRCGVGLSSYKATLGRFKQWGVLSAESRPPRHGAGHPWDYLYLHGDAINGQLRTLGAGHKARACKEPREDALSTQALRAALADRDRQLAARERELEQLRTALRHARTCDYCGSVLSATERACDRCRPARRSDTATTGAA